MLPSGGEVLGRYQLLLELASGGMATAYVARAQGAAGFERLVVIKRVHSHLVTNKGFLEMFVDEAKLASLVRHPSVVPVIDVVQSKGELFLVLEYVESVSLAVLLGTARATEQRLDPSVVSRILVDTLAGLHAAHEATDMQGQPLSIVHRDVSPQNIIVGVDGASRLIDFGIAKAAGRLTKTTGGVMKGKLGYMAPEQAKQKPVDRRSDVYAAGVVLHEALTGRRLFAGQDPGDILLNMLVAEVPPVTSVVPSLPKALDDVVDMALASDPDDRFDNASAFLVALENALPPAPTREVAKVVAELAADVLRDRQSALRGMMGGSQPELPPELAKEPQTAAPAQTTVREMTPPAAPPPTATGEEPVTDVSHVVPKPIRPARVAVGAFLVGGVLAAVLAIVTSSDPPAEETADGSAVEARVASSSGSPSASTEGPSVTPAGTASDAPSGAPSVSAAPPKKPAAPPVRRPPAPTAPVPTVPPPPPPALQDNPY